MRRAAATCGPELNPLRAAERLHEQAHLRHYSTFNLYSAEEFSRALDVFQHRLEAGTDADGTIEFTDENTWVAAERL